MRLASALLFLAVAFPVQAQDPDRGRQLYETHCLACHYERIHKRDPARSLIRSTTDLRLQVARWAAQVRRSFTPQEVDEIAAYLDRSHYRLDK